MRRLPQTALALGCAALVAAWFLIRNCSAPSPVREASPPRSVGTDAPASTASPSLGRPASAPSARAPATTSGPESPPTEQQAEEQTLVHGTLLEADGIPIDKPDGWVSFVSETGDRYEAEIPRGRNTYAVHGLPLGDYDIQATVIGYRTLEERFKLERAHPQVEKDLRFARATILSVFVHAPDGRNLADVVMETIHPPPAMPDLTTLPRLVPVATRASPGAWIPEVIGSANNFFGVGRFMQYGALARKRKEGSIGILIVDVEPPVYASLVDCHAVLQSQRVDPGADEVDFVIAADALAANASTITMRVLDAVTREPVPQAHAWVSGGNEGGGGHADADGRIVAQRCPPGRLRLEVGADGYETFLRSVQLDPGKTIDVGDILIGKRLELSFRVLDPQGQPHHAYFFIGLVDPNTMKVEIDPLGGSWSDESGVLKLSSLGRRLYVLRTSPTDPRNGDPVSGNVLIDLRAGILPPSQEIRLQRASRLVLRADSPLSASEGFRVIDEQGFEIVADRLWGSAPVPLSLPQGRYRVDLLGRDGDVVVTRSVELRSDTATCELRR
jgi:hypothetical protein